MSPIRIRSRSSGRKPTASPLGTDRVLSSGKGPIEAVRPATVKQRVDKRRAILRAQGLRPIQIWVPDTRAPGFAAEARRQARLLVDWERTRRAQAEIADWEAMAADPWEGL